MLCATVSKIITIDRRNNNIAKPHFLYSLAEAVGFGDINGSRSTMSNITKRAAPCANVAENHERRGSVTKALTQIWAGRFLADRIKAFFSQDFLETHDLRSAGKFRSNPFRFFQPLATFCWCEFHGHSRHFLFGIVNAILTHSCNTPGLLLLNH